MKPAILLLFILTVTSLSCNQKSKVFFDAPQEVVISGQIINKQNYHPNTVAIIINDINDAARAGQIHLVDDLDEEGKFKVRFKRYYPQEVMLKYFTIWEIFTHPGDSIYIELDAGKLNSNEEIYDALKFAGDAVLENKQLNKFNALFAPIRKKESSRLAEEGRYSPDEYINYRDSLRKSYHQLADKFIIDNQISGLISTWIYCEIERDYFHGLIEEYPFIHSRLNNLPGSWKVPLSYYNIFKDANFSPEFVINGDFAETFLREYFIYIMGHVQNELDNQGLSEDSIMSNGRTAHKWKVNNHDSVYFDGIKRYTNDGIIRQLVLNNFFLSRLRYEMNTGFYENNIEFINEEITEPYLIAHLQHTYQEIKELEEISEKERRANIIDTENNVGTEILKQIVTANKGKVIYIDCWATWCGPCIMEMPNSRKLMAELKDKNIEFVYLCCHSPKESARKRVESLKLGGTHYFLTEDQTNHIEKALMFSSYPNYILIDKQGNIVESSPLILPGSEKTRTKILELIDEDV